MRLYTSAIISQPPYTKAAVRTEDIWGGMRPSMQICKIVRLVRGARELLVYDKDT